MHIVGSSITDDFILLKILPISVKQSKWENYISMVSANIELEYNKQHRYYDLS